MLLLSSSILVFNNLLPEMEDFFYTAELYCHYFVMAIFLTAAVPTYFTYRQQFQEHLFFF
jgi:hypothetical protein